ncbi:hypothetical protein MSAN_01417800 [Mycena sanguinolenta]|uniref:Uncharacterized protein n=1 Tax=Mycena sanguinolenta TaxID=230812 RepID=A0A8H6Y696_9AGAR|nr:hypothetical protein MSAN_01417800 [Mycena sanguinolenta]
MATFIPSTDEDALVSQLFARGAPHKLGVLTGEVALELFHKTNLPIEVLSDIWTIADKEGHGWLTQTQTAVALRLIGWAQSGVKATPELLDKPGPLANFSDAPSTQGASSDVPPTPPPKPPPPAIAGPSKTSAPIPPLTPTDKAKFQRLFASSGPVNGWIDGDRAREIFSKSKLAIEPLSQIWELADIERRGALDLKGFTIALHLIQGLMNNQFSTVPPFLPNELYEQAAAPVPEPSSPLSPLSMSPPSTTFSNHPQSPSTASSSNQYLSVQTDLRSRSVPPALPSRHSGQSRQVPDWDIPADVRAISDRQFDALDPLKSGFIHDNISLPLLLRSKLPPDEVAQIWALADHNNDGKLTRDGFAVALFLIDERRRGKPIPSSPPPFMKTADVPQSNGKQRQSQYIAEQPVNGQLSPPPSPPTIPHTNGKQRQSMYLPEKPVSVNGQLSPPPSPNLHRQPSHLRYPSLPTQSTNVRFSSLWTPNNFPGSPSSPPPMPMRPPMPPPDTVAQLTRQVQEMQEMITQLRRSHVEKATTIANLSQENGSLRAVVEELQVQLASHDHESQKAVHEVLVKENEALQKLVEELNRTVQDLQLASSNVEMQRIQYEDLVRENERLNECVREMRESTTQLPWSGGDSELQTLINEDLARENARLRTEAREMQENVAQLQEATSGYEEQRRVNAELAEESERRQGMIQALQTNLDAQRTEVGQLTREVARLKTQLRAANTRAAPIRGDTMDLPPPAYDELGTIVV